MSDEKTSDSTIRTQADADDARLEARMKAIMENRAPAPAKAKAAAAPTGNPDWMKAKPKAKPQTASADKPARAPKRKAPAVKPPRNSEESWKLATEYATGQDEDE